jgi:hypothetical protein
LTVGPLFCPWNRFCPWTARRDYGYDASDAILLERKDDMKRRGLASPDDGDALALTFAYAATINGRRSADWAGVRVHS